MTLVAHFAEKRSIEGRGSNKTRRSRWIVDRPETNEKAIFIAALDYKPGPERAAYLDSACGDNSRSEATGRCPAGCPRASG